MNTTSAKNPSPSYTYNLFDSHDVVFTSVATALNTILSLPLNGYVMWLILAGARGTLASDFFSLNLAMSEFIFCLFCLFYFGFVLLKSFSCFEVFIFSHGFLTTARPFFQCYICVECYIGVVHPVTFLRYKPLRYRVSCCCVAWLITLSACFYSLYTYFAPLHLYAVFIQNLIFFSVMLFCCLNVVRALKHPGPGEKVAERKKSNRMKRRAFKIILLILISLTLNLFLYNAAVPLQCCIGRRGFTRVLTICVHLMLFAGFVQPLLYLHRSGKLVCFKEL